jgi:hypothetical protein
MRYLKDDAYYFAGVEMRRVNLSSSNLSRAVFEDALSGEGWAYPLVADLEGVVYNELTQWPPGYTPPASTVGTPSSPVEEN